MVKEERNNMKYPSTFKKLRSYFDKDKDYFIRLCQATKDNWKQSLVLFIGLTCLFTVILLYLNVVVIGANVFIVSFLAIFAVMVIAWWRINRKVKAKKVVRISSTLHFAPSPFEVPRQKISMASPKL